MEENINILITTLVSNSDYTSALYIQQNRAIVNPHVVSEPGEQVLNEQKKINKINHTNK